MTQCSIQVARAALCVAIAMVALLVPTAAEGRNGTLDTSFGGGGQVALGDLAPFRMATGQDDSIAILSGGPVVSRFLPDGRPDPGFGEGGHRSLPEIEGLDFYPSAVAGDSQGRILVFGRATDPLRESVEVRPLETVPVGWVVVLRLNRDGSLDESFGGGRGFVRSDFGLRSELPTDAPTVSTLAGGVDSQDRPVLLVGVANGYAPCFGHSGIGATPRALVRLTATGDPDAAFGGGDGVSSIGDRPTPLYSHLEVTAGDRLVAIVGSTGCGGPIAFRLAADGSPLPRFGGDGIRYPGLEFGAADSSGALILRVGRPTKEVVRIAPDGRRDKSFGKGGSASVVMPAGVRRSLRPVGFDAQGRMILVGAFTRPPKRRGGGSDTAQGRGPRRGYLLAMRLLASGKPDLTFGNRGRIATPIGPNRRAEVRQAALDTQGRLVVFYSVMAGRAVVERVLARYLLDS